MKWECWPLTGTHLASFSDPLRHLRSKGDKDGKGKKNKKKKKVQPGKGRSLSEGREPESEYPSATVMALRFAVPSTSEEALPKPSVS